MAGILSRYEDEAKPPSPDLSSDYRLGWCTTAMLEGEQYLRNQPLYENISKTREYLLGFKNTLRGALGLSDLNVNEMWRIYNLLAGDWTDINPIWRYSSENHRSQRQAKIFSTLATTNYVRSGSDSQLNLMARQALESGTGVLEVMWDRQKGDLALRSRNPEDVLPIRPTDPDSYQGCLAVCYRRETTVNHARQLFPQHAEYIKQDRDASLSGIGMKHRDALRSKLGYGSVSAFEIVDAQEALPVKKLGAMPVVDLFYMYIDDPAINESSDSILMGDWDTDPATGRPFSRNYWSYVVKPGERKYPLKRLIIFTRRCVLYDGPSLYWHGMFPFIKFTPDPHPDLWFGVSPLWPCLPIQHEIDRIYRAISDHIQKVLRPPVYGDKNSISEPELRKIDPRAPGQRWRQNPHGKGVQFMEIKPLDPIVTEYLQDLRDRMEDISGVKALTQAFSIGEAGQIPEGETVEKLMRFVSTQNRARSRQLERAQIEAGQMQTFNFMEFYDQRKRFAAMGEDGITVEDFDFDPDSIIPAYTNGDFKDDGRMDSSRVLDPRPRMDRAREFGAKFALNVKPGTLIESASQNRKMMYMIARSRADVDLWTFQKEIGMENIGPEPKGNVYERTMAEKMMGGMAAMPGMQQAMGAGAGSGAGPAAKEGRPNVFKEPPHIEGDAGEETVATS